MSIKMTDSLWRICLSSVLSLALELFAELFPNTDEEPGD